MRNQSLTYMALIILLTAASLAAAQTQTVPQPSEATSQPILTRQQAEQLAIKNNPHVSIAKLEALVQRQAIIETRSADLPSAYGNVSAVDAENGSRVAAGSLTASRLITHVGAGVSVSQLITDFGHTRNLIASSSLQAKASEQMSEATQEDIILTTDIAFYTALEAQATLQVAKSTVSARQAVTDQVNALTASKLKSTLDQSFAQVNLSEAKLLELDSQNQTEAALAQLNEVLGNTNDTHYTLVDDPATPDVLQPSPEAVIALALQQRPDLRSLQLNHEADVHFSRAQHEQFLPTISAAGTIGAVPVGSTTYFAQDWYGAAGVNVSVPIFNGFKLHAEAQEADLKAKASNEHTRELGDRIVRDVRTAWLSANTALQRVTVTHQLLEQSNTALDLAQTRYRLGLSSIVELSQAQLQQTQAQIAEANARFEYEADLAKLRFQTGSQP